MAALFVSVLQVFNDLGMGAALIQKKETEINDDYYNTAFFTGLAWSLVFYAFVSFAVGRFAAWFFEQPVLVSIVPFLCIGILLSPINLAHRVRLTRDLNFKALSIINSTGNLGSGILALLVAWYGGGVWALVVNAASASIFKMPLFWWYTKWRPSFSWSNSIFREIFRFGMYTMGTGIVGKAISQSDYLIIGKLAGPHSLGIYTFAFLITNVLRSQLAFLLNKIMFPVFGKLQSDREKAVKYYYRLVRYNAIAVYPVLTMLMIFSRDILAVFYGDKWAESVPIITVLALSVFVSMLINASGSLLRGSGFAKVEFVAQIVKASIMIPAMYIGFRVFGVIGVAFGHLIATVVNTAIVCFILVRKMNVSPLHLFKAVGLPLAISTISYGVCSLLLSVGVGLIWNLIVFILLNALAGLFLLRKDILRVYSLIGKKTGPIQV